MQETLKLEGEMGYNHCACLLVRSWRLIMVRGADCPLVDHEFRCACGLDGREVFAIFCTFLWALALAERRCLVVNPPGNRALTSDETRMLALIAAAQNDCTATLDAHLTKLARRPLRKTLERSARELGAALYARRLRLPIPA